MATLAPDYLNLTRICEFARRLHQLHRLGGEDAIEREFNAVCRAQWGFTLDDFTDDDLSPEDHELSIDMFPEHGCLRVYTTKDEAITAFTDGAIECLKQIIADRRSIR